MKIIRIQDGDVTLRLTPEDCTQLARICDAATTEPIATSEANQVETIGAAFKAMATACYALYNMNDQALACLAADLQDTGLQPRAAYPCPKETFQ